MKILVDQVAADEGSVEWGYETHVGYFAQDHKEIFEGGKSTVEAWLWDFCPGEPVGFVRGKLGMVLFSSDEVEKKVGSLSGGEAARLVFARLGVQKPNVLLLDEPTNHLDLEAIDALVKGLKEYDGTLILVSHDRWFVSQLANRVLEISPKGIEDYRGNLRRICRRLRRRSSRRRASGAQGQAPTKGKPKPWPGVIRTLSTPNGSRNDAKSSWSASGIA